VPKWTEFSITLMIIAMGFALFSVAVKYLPIFSQEQRAVNRLVESRPSPWLARRY